MSFSLYQKYRPGTFDELIGQDAVRSTLESSLSQGSFSHAYLFAGPRGTGKTSTARLVAKSLQISPEDVYEIDAASYRGIDDVRELREAASAPPYVSPYKLYILDEAHMLTGPAWNALLKTLEEPPVHTIFVLATTELHKVPDTIISRCEVYRFSSPEKDLLATHLQNVAKKEGKKLSNDAAALLAQQAGSYRDALGLLQQVLSTSKKEVDAEAVEKHVHTDVHTSAKVFLENFVAGDAQKMLAVLEDNKDSLSPQLFLEKLIALARGELLEKVKGTAASKLTSLHLRKLLQAKVDSQTLPDPLLALELLCAEIGEKNPSK